MVLIFGNGRLPPKFDTGPVLGKMRCAMPAASRQNTKRCLVLSCNEPGLDVEFSMRPGEFARVGAGDDMEISLPLAGLQEEEGRILMDDAGRLWMAGPDGDDPGEIVPPAAFLAGPYHFTIREVEPKQLLKAIRDAAAAAPAAAGQAAPPPEAVVRRQPVAAVPAAFSAAPAPPLAPAAVAPAVAAPVPPAAAKPAAVTAPEPRPLLYHAPHTYDRPGAGSPWKAGVTATGVGVLVLAAGLFFWKRSPREAAKNSGPPPSRAVSAAVAAPAALPPPVPAPEPTLPLLAGPAAAGAPLPVVDMDLALLSRLVRPCVFAVEMRDVAGKVTATGTGFAISPDGLIAVNHHVIQGGGKLQAITPQGARFSQVRIVAEDEEADLAIVQLEAKNLAVLPLGASGTLTAGKKVAAYAGPAGREEKLSEGVFSGKRWEPAADLPNDGELLLTTIPVAPGASGSPLLDSAGYVVGIMTVPLAAQRNQKLNFAVPVEFLKALLSPPETALQPQEEVEEAAQTQANAAYFADLLTKELTAKMAAADWTGALPLAAQLAQKHPEAAAAHFNLGRCASQLRQDQQAEAAYVRSTELDPARAVTWNNLGVVRMRRGADGTALASFEKAVACDSRYAPGLANMARCSMQLKNWAKAAAALEALLPLDRASALKLGERLEREAPAEPAVQRVLANLRPATPAAARADATASNAQGQPDRYRVTGIAATDGLAVRAGPGVRNPSVGTLAGGVTVEITGPPQKSGRAEWLPIRFENLEGWVRSKYLKQAEEEQP